MIRVLLTSLIFFIFSCNPSKKEKIENKILNLAEQLIEINGIYESNNEIYENIFLLRRQNLSQLKNFL